MIDFLVHHMFKCPYKELNIGQEWFEYRFIGIETRTITKLTRKHVHFNYSLRTAFSIARGTGIETIDSFKKSCTKVKYD